MIFWIIAIVALIVDQLTKSVVKNTLTPGRSVPVVRNYFHLTYVRNPGGAFGLMPSGPTFFLIASIAVVIVIIGYKLWRRPSGTLFNLALALVLGGAAGNLVDRFVYGEVIDWLDFRVWPVFNIADAVLVVGLALLALEIFLSDKRTEE